MAKQIGVLLSGCGVFDGTEIHEAVLTLLFLDRAGASVQCMAPDMDQFHVINHLTQQESDEEEVGPGLPGSRVFPGSRPRGLRS